MLKICFLVLTASYGGNKLAINANEVVYVEQSGYNSIVHLIGEQPNSASNNKVFPVRDSLDEVVKQLSECK